MRPIYTLTQIDSVHADKPTIKKLRSGTISQGGEEAKVCKVAGSGTSASQFHHHVPACGFSTDSKMFGCRAATMTMVPPGGETLARSRRTQGDGIEAESCSHLVAECETGLEPPPRFRVGGRLFFFDKTRPGTENALRASILDFVLTILNVLKFQLASGKCRHHAFYTKFRLKLQQTTVISWYSHAESVSPGLWQS